MCESELVFTDRKGFTRQTDHVGDGLRRSWRHSSNHNRLPRRAMSVARKLSAGSHPRRTQSSAQLVASQSRDPVGLSRPERKSGGITDAKTLSLMQVTGSASEKTILKFHLFGNVSGREFQSIRRILQWIADAYAPRVEFYCQEEFEETAANTIKKQATELGGEVLQHCNTEWLLYALLSDGEALYFGTKNDILKWASAEFLYQGSGEGDAAQEIDIDRATAEKISAVIKTSGHAFCRITFGLRAPPPGKTSALGSETLPFAIEHTLDVLFEIFRQHVPKTSAAFLTVAQRGQYDGCPVHRFVPGGWIQAGDVVDGSGGHSGAISASPSPESFLVTHDAAGVLGMCPCATGGTGTQFYVSLKPLAAFDKKFVAIGRSVMGMNALLLLLQRQLVPFDANTQRPAGDALFIKKIDVFID